jgi:hypothetical protein
VGPSAGLLQSEAVVAVPVSSDEQLATLFRKARELVRRGWCRGYASTDADGRPSHWPGAGEPTHFSLVGAVRTAGEGGIAAEHALRTLRRLTQHHNLVAWNDHPIRTQAAVLELLDKAIAEHGGRVPRGRGGWTISQ